MNNNFVDIIDRDNWVILDTETTGLHSPAEICEIAIINRDMTLLNTRILTRYQIPAEATAIHGITDEMVQYCPTWKEIRGEVINYISNKDVIVYNADYDYKMLNLSDQAWGILDLPYYKTPQTVWHCAMLAYSEYYGEWNDYFGNWRWHKLIQAHAQQGLPRFKQHGALADCEAVKTLMYRCLSNMSNAQIMDE